jgi:hypothetical protein
MKKLDTLFNMVICIGCHRICNNFSEFEGHAKYKHWMLNERNHDWQWLKNYAQ